GPRRARSGAQRGTPEAGRGCDASGQLGAHHRSLGGGGARLVGGAQAVSLNRRPRFAGGSGPPLPSVRARSAHRSSGVVNVTAARAAAPSPARIAPPAAGITPHVPTANRHQP